MKHIVILDGASMAGHIISDYFSSLNYKVTPVDINNIFNKDYTPNGNSFKDDADYVINCVRCLVEESELNKTKALFLNSIYPTMLEKFYSNKKTKLVHLSTDCVFSGERGDYNEQSQSDGISVYSKTKSLGELINNKDITIRTSYIGPNINDKSEELFDWFLLHKQDARGYTKAFWNGVTTLELAKNIKKLIEIDFSGVYHMIGRRKISKFDLLSIIKKIWKKDIEIHKDNNVKIDRSLVDSNKLLKSKEYDSMFFELYEYMNRNRSQYQKYY